MDNRIVFIDRMRGLAILSVVIQHLAYNFENHFVFHDIIGIANMPVFFFISGFILEKTSYINSLRSGFMFVIKKTLQLLLPFLIWPLVVRKFFFTPSFSSISFVNVIDQFHNPDLWFLLVLFQLSILFALSKIFIKKRSLGILFFWLIIQVILFYIWYKFGFLKLTTLHVFYFSAGIYLSNKNNIHVLFSNKVISSVSLLIIPLIITFWSSGSTSILNVAIKIICASAIIIVIYNLVSYSKWNLKLDKFINDCSAYSLAIYVIHWNFLLLFFPKILFVQNELISFIVLLFISIIICYACIYIKKGIEKFKYVDFILFGSYKLINLK